MKLLNVPYYCGGRLLAGLFTPNYPMYFTIPDEERFAAHNDNELISLLIKDQRRGNNPRKMPHYYSDLYTNNYPYIPETFDKFQLTLGTLMGYFPCKRVVDVDIAVIYAVTNSSQQLAKSFLKRTGFIEQGTYKKMAGDNCVTWIGDVYNNIIPILKTLEVKPIEAKIRKF